MFVTTIRQLDTLRAIEKHSPAYRFFLVSGHPRMVLQPEHDGLSTEIIRLLIRRKLAYRVNDHGMSFNGRGAGHLVVSPRGKQILDEIRKKLSDS